MSPPREDRETIAANKAGEVLDQNPGPVTPGVLLNALEAALPEQLVTPAEATDLASALVLVNDLRAKLQALGFIEGN